MLRVRILGELNNDVTNILGLRLRGDWTMIIEVSRSRLPGSLNKDVSNMFEIKAMRMTEQWATNKLRSRPRGTEQWCNQYVKIKTKTIRELTNDATNKQKIRIPAKDSDTTMLMSRLQERLNIEATMLRSRPSDNRQMMQQISKNQGFRQKTLIPLC